MNETILTPKQLDLLHAIRYEQVTWHAPNGRGMTYRLWDSETTYKVVTRLMKRIPGHLFERHMAAGFTYIQRGYCELTSEGRQALARQQGSSDGQSDTSLADGSPTPPEPSIGADSGN